MSPSAGIGLEPREQAAAASMGRLRGAVVLHFAVCSIGLLQALLRSSSAVMKLLGWQPSAVFHPWARPFYFPEKPELIAFYLAAGAGLPLYFAGCQVLAARIERSAFRPFFEGIAARSGILGAYAAVLGLANAAVWTLSGLPMPNDSAISRLVGAEAAWILWLALFLAPAFSLLWSRREAAAEAASEPRWDKFLWIALACVCLQFLSIFLPFVAGPLRMMNEFADIPEQTKLGDAYVDNAAYINEHRILGLTRYSPERDRGRGPLREGYYAYLPARQALADFVRDHETDYAYDPSSGALSLNRGMSLAEKAELGAIYGDLPGVQRSIDGLYLSSLHGEEELASRIYTAEELEFVRKNSLELHWQVLNRWVIHHHNFVLGPINEYALGKPLGKLNVQYGLFNVIAMRALLERLGGITYQNYMRLWFAFWPLYYALFIACALWLFRSPVYVLLVCLLNFSAVCFIDQQILFLGPGLNPIRHFFDMAVAAFFLQYLRKGSGAWLLGALSLSALAIADNREFGLFIFLALSGACVIRWLWRGRSLAAAEKASACMMVLVLAGAGLAWGRLGGDVMAPYYLKGFLGFPLSWVRVGALMLAFVIAYAALARYFERSGESKFLLLYFLFYTQAACVYFIWGATNNHLLMMASIGSVFIVLLARFIIEHSRLLRYQALLAGGAAAGLFALAYLPSLAVYYGAQAKYSRIFKDHKVYEWNLERARFLSTMDPKGFEDAVGLIRRLAPAQSSVFIISKYDNFIPFLAGRYSAMPLFDLPWFLLTPKETRLCEDAVRRERPEVLFVDTDIERSLIGDVVSDLSPFQAGGRSESLLRVRRLGELRKLFTALKGDYELAETGLLLSAYRLKAKAAR